MDSMHTEARTGNIDRIYLHTNEGHQAVGAAHGLAHNLLNNGPDGGGYHVVVDDTDTVVLAPDSAVAWAEGGDNQHALSICLIGFSATTDWTTAYSKAMIERAAQQVAHWCKAYSVPVVHVHPGVPGQAPTDRGIAEHADDHAPSSQGHTDPGSRFPIAAFVARVGAILAPPVDWQAILKLEAWAKRVSDVPLEVGDTGDDVVTAKALLAKAGFDCGNREPIYGDTFVDMVHDFKVLRGLSNLDGTKLGAEVVKSLGL